MQANLTTWSRGMRFATPAVPSGYQDLSGGSRGEALEGEGPRDLLAAAGLLEHWGCPDRVTGVLINGVSASPLLPSWGARVADAPEAFAKGAKLLAQAFGVEPVLYANEDEVSLWSKVGVGVVGLARRYPQELEEMLVLVHTGKVRPAKDMGLVVVPAGDLPLVAEVLGDKVRPSARDVLLAWPGGATVRRVSFDQTFRDLLQDMAGRPQEVVVGNLLNGRAVQEGDTIGPWAREVVLLPLRTERPLLGFLRIGGRIESDRQGELRFCVNCSRCEAVCPVELLPQFLHKLIQADLLDEAEELGLARCIECGLCAHVCPSKIELLDILSRGKRAIGEQP